MDYEPVMNDLIKKVVRKFYEPHHVVIADILLRKTLLYDTELCERMKMLSKEVNRLIIKLREDKIIKYETKVESREDNGQILRTVYYINYAEVRDVIKYKIFKMTKNLENNIKMAQVEGYVCMECGKEYSSLDAQCLMENYVFKCEDCKGDLVENKKDRSADCMMYSNLMSELDDIVLLLKETDKFNIPSMDYFQVLQMKKEKESKEIPAQKDEEVSSIPLPTVEEFDLGKPYVADDKGDHKEDIKIDEYVTVGGAKKLFADITEEDKEMMDEAEYEEYYEVYSRYHDNSGS
ncbi:TRANSCRIPTION INITIATION FACTOR TFIIE ALPHA SUBUNIT [Encephalitozoon cuniculi GB-M1]|uniref:TRANSCRIPTION INITIATION FACTOR TFIIE ALPHA SUBUNIT n=2 Tax=Encephalitozoon cuniculi TaxID=6035 RepID=Q8SRL9_ENCCU|nr:transcription factor TFIIE subunit TFA1 [Encephalitozoon cuniculi GB-M1]AGE96373.1 transcription initiation factor tfIIe alpha subunit [Encephalitozoon cuniculi]KMV65745.1 transcription initiation factor IIE subunitalpha [Encephalitozoon cuniculi EcunIII-L]UYI27178.1 transcription initiation factor TFIIE subunit alpha [Encephalitozoon cuniculi]CAD25554.1 TRANSCRIPTION INITIATION FACTOR TFIIE ALPHA SUBUNIT [Encephalitozoon cuniculi GB-M1]